MPKSLKIVSAGDANKVDGHLWGDAFIKHGLEDEFALRGYEVVSYSADGADAAILLSGWPRVFDHADAKKNYCWIISRPDYAQEIPLERMEHIWVNSHQFLPIVKNVFDRSSLLIGGTGPNYHGRVQKPEYDLIFLGNQKSPRPEVWRHLIETGNYRILLAGEIHDELKGEGYDFYGYSVSSEMLPAFYNKAWIHVYMTHQLQRKWGFISPTPFNAMAWSDCLTIHEYGPGLLLISPEIVSYDEVDDLICKIDYYLARPWVIEQKTKTIRRDLDKFYWENIVNEMEDVISQ